MMGEERKATEEKETPRWRRTYHCYSNRRKKRRMKQIGAARKADVQKKTKVGQDERERTWSQQRGMEWDSRRKRWSAERLVG